VQQINPSADLIARCHIIDMNLMQSITMLFRLYEMNDGSPAAQITLQAPRRLEEDRPQIVENLK